METTIVNEPELRLVETFYDTDKTQIKERYYVDKNGLRQGMYQQFYSNGTIATECNYKDDCQHGLTECFYGDGRPTIRCVYNKNVLHGLYEWFENREVAERILYIDGVAELSCIKPLK